MEPRHGVLTAGACDGIALGLVEGEAHGSIAIDLSANEVVSEVGCVDQERYTETRWPILTISTNNT